MAAGIASNILQNLPIVRSDDKTPEGEQNEMLQEEQCREGNWRNANGRNVNEMSLYERYACIFEDYILAVNKDE